MGKRKYTYEEVKHFIEVESNSDCKLISTEYHCNSDNLIIECRCETRFNASFSKFKDRNKRQCNKCSGMIPWNIDSIKQFIEIDSMSGCKLISKIYTGIKDKIDIECRCGRPFSVSFDVFKNKKQRQCGYCSNKINLNTNNVREYVNDLGYELISDYINSKENIIIKDKYGFYYCVLFHNLKKYKTLPIASTSNIYSIQNIQLWCKLNIKSFELISNTYKKGKLKWKCLKDDCGEIFEMSWDCIQSGQNCSYCAGKKVGLSNCLATKNPELTKEWHSTKNGKLTPYDVTANSGKKIWWQCSKNPKHEWDDFISNRNKSINCPYCSHERPSEDYNLLKDNPELCEEWDYKKNKKKPEEYTPGSGEYVYWKCKECGHEWYAQINSRNRGIGCPECNKSKGEKECKRVFISKGFIEISQEEYNILSDIDKNKYIYFIPQMKFDNLIGLGGGLLSYDFYIPKYNLLTEYDGEFHYKPIKKYKNEPMKYAEERLRKQQIHDKFKDEYAQDNKIILLRIPYWDFDNIESILTKELGL